MDTNTDTKKHIAITALLVLFFIQILTTWFESIYRMGLIKTSMGLEILGVLLIFLPVVLLVVPQKLEGLVLKSSLLGLLVVRAVMPLLGVQLNIVVGGIGIADGLIVLAYVLSGRHVALRKEIGAGSGIGLLLSIVLRVWGSSYDITLGGPNIVLGWSLILVAGALMLRTRFKLDADESTATASPLAGFLVPVGVLANLAVIFWMFSSPAVISAWAGTYYELDVLLLVSVWGLALWQLPKLAQCGKGLLVIWNLAFLGLLIVGVKLHTPDFPAAFGDAPTIFYPPTLTMQMPFYLVVLLSPVVLANVLFLAGQGSWQRPNVVVLPVVLGFFLLMVISIMGVWSNTWGYMGNISAPFRGGFYIHLLLNGVLMLLPVLLLGTGPYVKQLLGGAPTARTRLSGVLIVLVLAGLLVKGYRKPIDLADTEITVLTYNMQLGSEPEGDQNYHDQIRFLREVDADIVGLQESDAARPGGGNIDPGRMFADALGYEYYYGPSVISGTFGTAILSRFPLENPYTIFSYSTQDEAGTAIAEITIGDRKIGILNSHPAGSTEAKMAHINDVIEYASKYDHVIAVGDYNSRQGEKPYDTMAEVYRNSWYVKYPDKVVPLWPESKMKRKQEQLSKRLGVPIEKLGMRAIDHVFISEGFEVVDSFFVPTPDSETDHPAHWSILRLK